MIATQQEAPNRKVRSVVRWVPTVLGITVSLISFFAESWWKSGALFFLGLGIVASKEREAEKEKVALAIKMTDAKASAVEEKYIHGALARNSGLKLLNY